MKCYALAWMVAWADTRAKHAISFSGGRTCDIFFFMRVIQDGNTREARFLKKLFFTDFLRLGSFLGPAGPPATSQNAKTFRGPA